MRRLLDAVLLLALLPAAPCLLILALVRGRSRTGWAGRFGAGADLPPPARNRPRVVLFGVSVGEIHALRCLVDDLLEGGGNGEAGVDVVIASTTDTGFARAQHLYAARCHVVRWPLDFSFAVDRFLDRVQPALIALVELEVWPGMTRSCAERGIPIGVINGRLSARSFVRYRRIAKLIRPAFRRLAFAAVQTQEYADRFISLGTDASRIRVTGTMKWDTAQITGDVPGAAELGEALGIDRSKPLVVAGSTAREEHALLHRAVPAGVQLLCAPRKPEVFDDAAEVLAPCVRRTEGRLIPGCERFLLDTIGELRQAYALADVVVVGRTFGALHGSDMMEPVALGKPVVMGPAYGDFHAAAEVLRAANGLTVCSAEELPHVLTRLLADPVAAQAMAARGRAVIRAHQGASRMHAQMIRAALSGVIRRE